MKIVIILFLSLLLITCSKPYDEGYNDVWQRNIYLYDYETEEYRQITYASERLGFYRISQSGEMIVYTTENATIMHNLRSGEEIQILDWGAYNYSISPSGNQVAYIAQSEDSSLQIYLYRLNDRQWTRLTANSLMKRNIRFVTDTSLYFLGQLTDTLSSNTLYRVDVQDKSLSKLTSGIYYINNYWQSNNPSRIICNVYRSRDYSELRIIDLQQDSLQFITNVKEVRSLTFFSQSDSIIFDMQSGIDHDIFVMSITGGEKIKLTDDDKNDEKPSISTDDDLIAYISQANDILTLFIRTRDGSDQRIIEQTSDDVDWFSTPCFIPGTKKSFI